MNEHESPPIWEGVDDDVFMGDLAKPLESTEIITHIAKNINMVEHLAVIEPHEPMETRYHSDSEYLKIADATVKRIVRRHRRAMKSNLH